MFSVMYILLQSQIKRSHPAFHAEFPIILCETVNLPENNTGGESSKRKKVRKTTTYN